VAAYDTTAGTGYIFGFASSGGVLTPLNGGVPLPAGTHPSAMASDPSGAFLYVTDLAQGNILAYSINSGSLTQLAGSPFPAGNQPSAIAVDVTGKFAVVANSQDATVATYSLSNGALQRVGTFATGLQPVAIGIDPALNEYVFTANFLGDNVSGFRLDINSGSLLNSQFSPFKSNAQPTAVAAIPHHSQTK
jgi:DNA-binding beta-propeller fold protein YncE